MNAQTKFATGMMTEAGEILIPSDIRERAGLAPGRPYRVTVDENGRVVVEAGRFSAEESAQRREQVEKAIKQYAGKFSFGTSTDEYMREIRGDEEP